MRICDECNKEIDDFSYKIPDMTLICHNNGSNVDYYLSTSHVDLCYDCAKFFENQICECWNKNFQRIKKR